MIFLEVCSLCIVKRLVVVGLETTIVILTGPNSMRISGPQGSFELTKRKVITTQALVTVVFVPALSV